MKWEVWLWQPATNDEATELLHLPPEAGEGVRRGAAGQGLLQKHLVNWQALSKAKFGAAPAPSPAHCCGFTITFSCFSNKCFSLPWGCTKAPRASERSRGRRPQESCRPGANPPAAVAPSLSSPFVLRNERGGACVRGGGDETGRQKCDYFLFLNIFFFEVAGSSLLCCGFTLSSGRVKVFL